MQSTQLIRQFVVVISFIGCESLAFGSPSACNLPLYHLCLESPTMDLTKECANNGGVLGQACSVEQRVGSCAKRQGEHAIYLRYYQGVTFDPIQNCKENGGVYTPG